MQSGRNQTLVELLWLVQHSLDQHLISDLEVAHEAFGTVGMQHNRVP